MFDDSFFNIVLDNNIECVELILRIILNREDIKVLSVHTQHEVRNIGGHSVRFDVAAVGADALDKGSDYEELPESYVIFITENDVMGAGLPVYVADRVVLGTGKALGDGSHIIYVNGAYKNTNDPVGKLMHDFKSKSAEGM